MLWWGFLLRHPHIPRHSYPTLSTAHASRTHVKALQTDLHAKPDNSSGPTHDSPSKRPLRTKVTFQPKTAPKKHREHQAVRGSPKPNTDQLSSMPIQSENRDQGPKGNTETKTASSSMLRAMEEALKASGQNPWLHASVIEAFKACVRRLVSVSLSLERKIYLSFSLFRLSIRVSLYLIRIYIIELQILQLSLLQILHLPTAYSATGAVMVAVCEKTVRGAVRGLTWGYMPLVKHEPSAIPKRPRPVRRNLLQDFPGPCPLLCCHVSLMALPYRRAKSFAFSLYVSVLMPFTSSTTSSPVSLSM